MSNFPSVNAKEFIKVIEKLGFYLDRQKGSHAIYKDSVEESWNILDIHHLTRWANSTIVQLLMASS